MADSGYPPSAPSASAVESAEPPPAGHFAEHGSSSEDEDEKILETSENKRWNKMSVQVSALFCPISLFHRGFDGGVYNCLCV